MSDRQLASGAPVPEDHSHTRLKANGQQTDYVVLTPEERAKGYVKPVRMSYLHTKCGVETRMSTAIAETYARNPHFYSGTFCIGCGSHFPLNEFEWIPDGEPMDTRLQEAWHAAYANRERHDGEPAPVSHAAEPPAHDCWSLDGSDYSYTSLQDLLDANDDIEAGHEVWRGKSVKATAADVVDADDVISAMEDEALGMAGDYAEDYPDVTPEARAELDAMLQAWVTKHCPPNFYKDVVDEEAYIVTAEDLQP